MIRPTLRAALPALALLAACASAPAYRPTVEGTGRDGVPFEQHLADCREHGRVTTSAGLAATRVAVTSAAPGAVGGAILGAGLGAGLGYGAATGARDGAVAGAAGAAAGGALVGAATVPTGVTAFEAAVDECLGWRGYRVVR